MRASTDGCALGPSRLMRGAGERAQACRRGLPDVHEGCQTVVCSLAERACGTDRRARWAGQCALGPGEGVREGCLACTWDLGERMYTWGWQACEWAWCVCCGLASAVDAEDCLPGHGHQRQQQQDCKKTCQ